MFAVLPTKANSIFSVDRQVLDITFLIGYGLGKVVCNIDLYLRNIFILVKIVPDQSWPQHWDHHLPPLSQ